MRIILLRHPFCNCVLKIMHLYYILLSDEYVLNLLNSGSIKVLVSDLVTVGPKRAQIIHAYRELYGSFKSFEDLYKVPSLKKKYIDTFLKNNLVRL